MTADGSPSKLFPHRPPCMANDDRISTTALMRPHESGIQVDIRKKPAV